MKDITRILLTVATVLLATSLFAEEQGQRFIVILKQRSGAVPDVAALGGTIESRQEDQLVVTIPAGSLAALKADPKVRYIERVGGDSSDADDVLIGVPADPAPGPASKLRLTPIALGSTPWSPGEYKYDGAGNIISVGTDNYLYDGVQRLKQSSTRGTAETYTYDGFGNMTAKTNSGNSMQIPSVDTATNRYTGGDYTYNEIGAVKTGASYVFTYDAFGQPLSKKYNNDSSTQEYYLYTPGDERIGVQRGGWWTWSVRDEGGKVLRQYRSSTTNPSAPSLWLEDFVWRDGLLLGSQRPPEMGGRRHYHLDHLGSPRLVTADNGQRISAHDYFPFGDEATGVSQEVPAGFDREDPMKFTGHERDYAGGMGGEDGHAIDDMHARYESPTLGRFFSPDPILGNLLRPQSWNRYAYVLSSPINFMDPSGLEKKGQGQPVGPGDTCDGVIAGGFCTSGEGITVTAKTPNAFAKELARDYAEFLKTSARMKADLARLTAYGMKHRPYGRSPDYGILTLAYTSPWFVGGGVSFAMDAHGGLYGGPAFAAGTPGRGVAFTLGWLARKTEPNSAVESDFVGGLSVSGAAGVGGAYYAKTWGGQGNGFADEGGDGLPGAGVNAAWMFGPYETGLGWR